MARAMRLLATIDINMATSYDEQHKGSDQKCCKIGDACLPHEGKQQFSLASQLLCHGAYSGNAGRGEQNERHEG